MSKRRKKSKYKNAIVGKKKYYFYKIRWIDITGDAGHKNEEEMDKLECCTMISQGYIYKIEKLYHIYVNVDINSRESGV